MYPLEFSFPNTTNITNHITQHHSLNGSHWLSTGVGRCSSQSGSERESEELRAAPPGTEPSAPVAIPESEELARRKEEARRKRRRKKRSGSSVVTSCFQGLLNLLYTWTLWWKSVYATSLVIKVRNLFCRRGLFGVRKKCNLFGEFTY